MCAQNEKSQVSISVCMHLRIDIPVHLREQRYIHAVISGARSNNLKRTGRSFHKLYLAMA